MKYFSVVALLIALLNLSACNTSKKKDLTPIDSKEEITTKSRISKYEDLHGNPVFLNDFNEKNLVLNFWSTHCKPCVEEMQDLERVKPILEQNNYKLFLVSNESIEVIENFKSKTHFNLDYIRYNGSLSELKIYALPTTFVFNKSGKMIKKIEGKHNWDSSSMLNLQ